MISHTDPRANSLLLKSDPDDYARLYRANKASEALHSVAETLTERKPIDTMTEDEQRDLYWTILGIERPFEIAEMLADFAADDEIDGERYREVAETLTDDAVKVLGEGMTALRRICAEYPELLAELDAIESVDRFVAETIHDCAVEAQNTATKRKSFRVLPGGRAS
jgi:hypothetical protein